MSLFGRVSALGVLGLTLCVAAPVSANLIVNGGFETPDVASGSWKYFSASDVDGWEGSNIEIWDNYGGVSAYEGHQFAELNAHPSSGSAFGIFQSFATTIGQSYDLSFAYRARRSDSESFNVSVMPGTDWNMTDHVVGAWSIFSSSFVASSALTTLTFTTVIPETGTVGNFLDDVKVTASVPEPGTMALLGLGLLGLGVSRRRQG